MRDVSCKLRNTTYEKNAIGVEVPTTTEIDCPIIRTESIYAKEFYKANEIGYKPSLRLRISALNYNNESELEYMGKIYTVIRTDEPTADEVILVCQRKVKDVKNQNRTVGE